LVLQHFDPSIYNIFKTKKASFIKFIIFFLNLILKNLYTLKNYKKQN